MFFLALNDPHLFLHVCASFKIASLKTSVITSCDQYYPHVSENSIATKCHPLQPIDPIAATVCDNLDPGFLLYLVKAVGLFL